MHMRVDQPRRHDPIAGVDHPVEPALGDPGVDPVDPAVADGDIGAAITA